MDERWYDTAVVLSCAGAIDILTAPLLEDALASAEARHPAAVIIDLSAVDFLASNGMGLLVAAHDRITPETGFAVVADGPGTSRPLTMIGIAEEINMHVTLNAALASVAETSSD